MDAFAALSVKICLLKFTNLQRLSTLIISLSSRLALVNRYRLLKVALISSYNLTNKNATVKLILAGKILYSVIGQGLD